jgi:PAT family beta-lactamase induction signal transducer AmpG
MERTMTHAKPAIRNPWAWVPTLYLAEGAPYVMAMTVSVILYKRLGISNTEIALYTSWLYLPWVIKPLWSPFVEMFRTKRFWIVAMQLMLGASFACVALTIPAPGFFRYTLAFFWIMAFSSATHDIAADGFYMLGLQEYQQAAFIGVRTIFYRIAMIAAKGILVVLALMATAFISSVSMQKEVASNMQRAHFARLAAQKGDR